MNNPIFKAIIAALKAGYAELSTPEAIQWYKTTATQAWLVISTIAVLAWMMIDTYLITPTEASTAPAPQLSELVPIYNLTASLVPCSGTATSSQRHMFYCYDLSLTNFNP